MKTVPTGDGSLLVQLEPEVSTRVHRKVASLFRAFTERPHHAVRNLHPAYCSILIEFDPLSAAHADIEEWVRGCATGTREIEARRITLPVCYGGEFGPDLEEVAALHRITPDEVVALHASVEYLVYFLGFSPGFPYLGGLPGKLATPRLPAPRTQVPAGSVAIGGEQTGIYPSASPGGWRLIGRTPVRLFDLSRQPPALLAMGDVVRFEPVSPDEFARLL